MAMLLTTELFDSFLLEEAVIDTFNTFHIDGKVHREFFAGSEEEATDFLSDNLSKWAHLRPICLDLIKGKRTPLGFKFVLHLGSSDKTRLLSEADMDISPEQVSPGLIIRFHNGEVTITTGISYSIFTLDKSAEKAWDSYIPSFLESNNIEFEIL